MSSGHVTRLWRIPFVFCAIVFATLPPHAGLATGGTTTKARPVDKPPYYVGRLSPSDDGVGYLTIAFDVTESGLPASWLPETALRRLATDLDATLAREATTRSLVALAPPPAGSVPPSVYFGCEEDPSVPGECNTDTRQNVLATTSADRAWRTWMGEAARAADVGRALVVRLSIAPHWIHQRGLKGAKQVRLGTDHAQPLPWLTSLETPVWVVQLTGAIVDADGKVLRSGAEGIHAVRTPFRASMVGAQQLLRDEDVESIRTDLRRDDLPDHPLTWEASLTQLLDQLTTP